MQLSKLLYIGLISILLAVSLPAVDAQSETIQLVITVPEWMGDFYNDEMFADFEAAHPGVDVVLSEAGGDKSAFVIPPAYDLEGFLTDIEVATTRADVMFVHEINPAATQAGFYLNLDPLVQADTNLNPSDFYPAAWQAYQWDGGSWALPVSLDLDFLIYTPAFFDAAGLAYPTPNWTIEDYASAAEALTQRDSAGNVTMPGFVDRNRGDMLRLFAGRGFYDDSQLPATPSFTFPELETLVTRWKELNDTGVVGFPAGGLGSDSEFGMLLGSANFLQSDDAERQAALLPGNVALAKVQAFAVSAGTQYPELAYELAKYLSNNLVAVYSSGSTPARQSLADAEIPAELPDFVPQYSPEIQTFIDTAVMNALPPSAMRYREYVGLLIDPPPDAENVTDVALGLQQAEEQAKADIQAAIEHRNTITLVVTPPATLPALAPGEVGINFGLVLNISPMPNRERWEAFAAEFAASDPEVGYVQIDPYFDITEHPATRYDCFYSEGWYLQNNPGANLITLDPLMSVDPTFDQYDFIPGALEAVRDNEGRTWAFPLLISPRILAYNTLQFDQVGLPYPENGWTISEFTDALQILHDNNGEIPFVPAGGDSGTYLYMLIAAFGGVPFDVTADEVHLNLTDPSNIEAIRQVLDLAKAGFIDYSPLANTGGDFSIGDGSLDENSPGIQSLFMSEEWQLGGPTNRIDAAPSENPYRYTTYPSGSTYMPVSYSVKGAYISNQAENPEACYRWISAISQQSDLFSGMPTRHSTIDQITDERVEVFRQYDLTLQSPNVILISDQWNVVEAYLANYIIGRAFDKYVLENADLQTELEAAQQIATDINTCIQNLNLPAVDLATATEADFEQQIACALRIDPSLSALFQSS